MFEIVFLGTSASAPSVHRGLSAQVVMHDEHRFLIDCGEGTQRQILQSGIGFKRLNRILITHGHLDHILGSGGICCLPSRAGKPSMTWRSTAARWALERIHDLLYGVVLRGARPPMSITCAKSRRGCSLRAGFQHPRLPGLPPGPGLFWLSLR